MTGNVDGGGPSKSLAITFTQQATTTKDSRSRAKDISNELIPAKEIVH